jgi:hypothetical protein
LCKQAGEEEWFHNSSALSKVSQGGFFLMKKPFGRPFCCVEKMPDLSRFGPRV